MVSILSHSLGALSTRLVGHRQRFAAKHTLSKSLHRVLRYYMTQITFVFVTRSGPLPPPNTLRIGYIRRKLSPRGDRKRKSRMRRHFRIFQRTGNPSRSRHIPHDKRNLSGVTGHHLERLWPFCTGPAASSGPPEEPAFHIPGTTALARSSLLAVVVLLKQFLEVVVLPPRGLQVERLVLDAHPQIVQ